MYREGFRLYWKGFSYRQVLRSWIEYLRVYRDIRKGVWVEDCSYKIKQVQRVEPSTDTVEMTDGSECSIFHCGVTRVELI